MNTNFDAVIAAGDDDRRDLFLTAATGLGTTLQNVEKDFWVCWTLDLLFNGLPESQPRLLFKGGTSLSKGFGLISRFSEDIDVTVFRDDLGEDASLDALEALSGKKRQARLDAIKEKASAYINGPLQEAIRSVLKRKFGEGSNQYILEPDTDDAQTLLFHYPSVVADPDTYYRSAVKIESGAKSALDPHTVRTIEPYVNGHAAGLDLKVGNVTIVDPKRTFWDKIVILHGLRRWFENRGSLYQGGQRISRHYYDVHRILGTETGERAIADQALGADCVRHARLFFNRPSFDLASAVPGSFALAPSNDMLGRLAADYRAMATMVFGEVPSFEDVIASARSLEARLNGDGEGNPAAAPSGG
ncbi:MAG TPA: nucleotidyl transferase AbiEii/AbiGii toxin family protein [Allosphingosinicella sp.]|jgi:hypothetical protein|nr:nucleotidyl transferase AbiEii/AbiGii toxin family protein [Allosphingosinicella sp.]